MGFDNGCRFSSEGKSKITDFSTYVKFLPQNPRKRFTKTHELRMGISGVGDDGNGSDKAEWREREMVMVLMVGTRDWELGRRWDKRERG